TPVIARAEIAHLVAIRRLDLDHLSAHIGEEQPSHRAGNILRQIQHFNATEKLAELRAAGLYRAANTHRIATGLTGLPVPPLIFSGTQTNRNDVAPCCASGSSTSPSIRGMPKSRIRR